MSFLAAQLPLSLYIHLPWCVRKCPYCDFNSHAVTGEIPEAAYVQRLLSDLDSHVDLIQHRPLISIFFGGGTPSLFSAQAIQQILAGVAKRIPFAPNIEITLEANPGTIEQDRFRGFRHAGINRLSLGIQSLQDDKLRILGRIHDKANALRAITIAKEAGFDNFNLDLMFGLPTQTLADALEDIQTAMQFAPTHFSWYQLTIEPNTFFYHQPPILPTDDLIWDIQVAGQDLLQQYGFKQYEVSAYSQPGKQCQHNLNYWEFGDYLGIGAGAHSKMTDVATGKISRFSQVKNPKDYLAGKAQSQTPQIIAQDDLTFEFMLNALRLTEGVPLALFTARTGIAIDSILERMEHARKRGLVTDDKQQICASPFGMKFLNDVVSLFLPVNIKEA